MKAYACLCCALPRKLVQHLADNGPPEHREEMRAQADHAAQLRSQRVAHGGKPLASKVGKQPLHRQVFDAQGQTFLPGKMLRDEDDPPVKDNDANDAYENVGIALQFYKDVLGRDSVDGKGFRIDASVHYGFRFANAMWTGEQMIVGDGDGEMVRGLAKSLGLIAHELSHGITQHIVGGGLGVVQRRNQPPQLVGEAGALNESFSDVFASMIKQWRKKQDADKASWLIGEDVLAAKYGKAVRSLKAPGDKKLTWKEDDQIWDARKFRPTDDCHRASGIPNHAFYTAAMELGGHSWEKLADIWFQGYDSLYSRATFLDAAHATIGVAAKLHGKGSPAHKAVKAGWAKVNVLG